MAMRLGIEGRYLEQVRRLNVNRSGVRRAPHKPLLLLVAIARLLRGQREIPFLDASSALTPLLAAYAPPVKSRHQPELPYWHLQFDGLWHVADGEELPRQSGGFPRMSGLRRTHAHLATEFARALESDPAFLMTVVEMLLAAHFPESVHADILEAVGLHLPEAQRVAESVGPDSGVRRRDPEFRRSVLRAYEHRCAVTGFRVALGGAEEDVVAGQISNGLSGVFGGHHNQPLLLGGAGFARQVADGQ